MARRSGVTAETAMVESRGRHVSDVILAETQKWRADVIVMGTHGRRGLNRVLLGSGAEGVLREAAVPVLLVRGVGIDLRQPPATLTAHSEGVSTLVHAES